MARPYAGFGAPQGAMSLAAPPPNRVRLFRPTASETTASARVRYASGEDAQFHTVRCGNEPELLVLGRYTKCQYHMRLT